jgi:hypothetical protein
MEPVHDRRYGARNRDRHQTTCMEKPGHVWTPRVNPLVPALHTIGTQTARLCDQAGTKPRPQTPHPRPTWRLRDHRLPGRLPGKGALSLSVFEAISERGHMLGAMTMYQRGKIQEESLYHEHKKHAGSPPLVGVNTFLGKDHGGEITTTIELILSTEDEKGQQVNNMRTYQAARNGGAAEGLKPLQHTARKRQNLFAALVEAVESHSLGQISHALYEVRGEYRRNTQCHP